MRNRLFFSELTPRQAQSQYRIHLPERLHAYLEEHGLLDEKDHVFQLNEECIYTINTSIQKIKMSFDVEPDAVVVSVMNTQGSEKTYEFSQQAWYATTTKIPHGKSIVEGNRRVGLFTGLSDEKCLEHTPLQVSRLMAELNNIISPDKQSVLAAKTPAVRDCCYPW